MLEKLRLLVGEEANEPLLSFALEEATELVCQYCHIQKLPHPLENMVVRMAADFYRNECLTQGGTTLIVTSIKEGDTSTSFSDSSAEKEAFRNSLLKNYYSQLNAYRRLAR